MTIRVNLPNGIVIEADTVLEALAVSRAFNPGLAAEAAAAEEKPVPRRTRHVVVNRDLEVLEAWGLADPANRQAMTDQEWATLARELGRTPQSVDSLVRRYSWGVYESSGSNPTAKVIVHSDRDRSRSKSEA